MSEAPPTLPTLELKPVTSIGDLLAREDALLRVEPPLPWYRRHALLLALFALPMTIATLYYGLIAADQYASEARFVVRSLSSGGSLAGLSLGAGGLNNTMMPSAQALGRATNDDTYSVNEYIRSRDAVERLEHDDDLRAILARHDGDFINRYPNLWTRNNKETLYRHFQNLVDVWVQSDSGISALEVRTFRPEDSQMLARALLAHAEELVNKLNVRARADAVKFASDVVQKAEDRVTRIQARITDFRNREMVVDPGQQSTISLELMSRINAEVLQERAKLSQITAMAPDSPQLASLRVRIQSLEAQMDQQRAALVGGDQAMAPKLAQFEQLTLERELAVKSLSSALLSLENARQEAQQQQLYLARVVEPNLPDQPLYPKRLLSLLFFTGLFGCIYWIAREVARTVLEHNP